MEMEIIDRKKRGKWGQEPFLEEIKNEELSSFEKS